MAFVGHSLETLASADPNAPALTCGARRWTRSGLFAEIAALAVKLQTRVPFGARVGLCLTDPASLLIAFFAVGRSGGVALVYDPDWPASRRASIDEAVKPALVLDAEVLRVLQGQTVPAGGHGAEPGPEEPFYAGFTSGSTGEPKGYLRSHRSWLRSFEVSAAEFPVHPQDRVVVPGNLVHSLHLYGAVHGLCVGAHVLVSERFNPRALARVLQEDGPAVLYATPTQIHFVATEISRTMPAANVRLVLASGAKWRDADRRAMAEPFPAARLVEFYGASEMSFITVSTPEDRVPDGSVGRAAKGVAISIRGEAGAECAAYQTGTIWVSSDMLYSGYICGGGSEVMRDQDWLTVGDCGYVDDKGFLYLAGRKNRMIVTSGVNIYPEEVEQVLLDHPAVAETAVLPKTDPVRGKILVAVVRLIAGKEVTEKELRRHCAARLGRIGTPRRFVIAAEMPLTPGGKLDLQMLQKQIDVGVVAS
ncbi:AMP-binding protein [Roseibium sp.]|uniref:AMP-binding protein n=1 Tax=Roseibium sp. TaxID=1936156 RepID=UPI003A973FE2